MPCNNNNYDEELDSIRIEKEKKKFIHNSPVSEMLCKIISHIGMENIENCLNPHEPIEFIQELKNWWQEHRKRDVKRIKDELHYKLTEFSFGHIKSLPSNERKLIDSHIKIECQIFPSETYKREIEE
jgi:hypothetical protein